MHIPYPFCFLQFSFAIFLLFVLHLHGILCYRFLRKYILLLTRIQLTFFLLSYDSFRQSLHPTDHFALKALIRLHKFLYTHEFLLRLFALLCVLFSLRYLYINFRLIRLDFISLSSTRTVYFPPKEIILLVSLHKLFVFCFIILQILSNRTVYTKQYIGNTPFFLLHPHYILSLCYLSIVLNKEILFCVL